MSTPKLTEEQYPAFRADWLGDEETPGLCEKGVAALASRWDMSYQTCWRWLDHLGLRQGHRHRQAAWTDDPDLGRVPDSVIAERYGVSRPRVAQVRKKKGLPSWKSGQAKTATITSSRALHGPGFLKWALALGAGDCTAPDVAARLHALATAFPDLPAGVVLGLADGSLEATPVAGDPGSATITY